MAAPGRDAVKGSRTDTYRLVWVAVFSLSAGETRSARELADAIDPKKERGDGLFWTVVRALRQAAEVRLVSVVDLPPPTGNRRQVWVRHAWPSVVSVRWLVERGASETTAKNVLHALEAAGWMSAEFRRAK